MVRRTAEGLDGGASAIRRGVVMRRVIRGALCCLLAFLICGCGMGVSVPASASEGGEERSVFSDVKQGSWYASVVQSMAAEGLLNGYPDGTFRPDRTISAAEFVSITARCASPEGSGQTGASGHWAAAQMTAALERGWYDWDEMPPTGEKYDAAIPRHLAAKILMRALLPDTYGKYDYTIESSKIKDFSNLNGRYYDGVLSAYGAGIFTGDGNGNFRPTDGLSRAEACAILWRARNQSGSQNTPAPTPVPTPNPAVTTVRGGVSENGWLQVKGTQLCNEKGAPVVLHGMSSHGIQWYDAYAAKSAIANTASFGANVFRVAMYTGEGGYLSQKDAVLRKTIAAVDAAIENDLYVIIDWHILSDGDPMAHIAEAEAFFTQMSERYGDTSAVLYEICNEPNGNVTWKKNIKPYAERIVKVIRANSPRAIILIGSGTWSQDIQDAASDPVAGENLMYTCHFYAGTHGAWLRERIAKAQAAGAPVFVSEWGVSAADGSGGVYLEESKIWLDFLDEKGISWVNWSLCDKNETSAALKSGTRADKTWTKDDLTASGQFVFSRF